MREILFRGKRVDNGEWVYGYHLSHLEKQPSPIKADFDKDIQPKHYILQDGFADWNMPKPIYQYDVIPETVGQYTGLCDKNGTKIFEGDIVRFYEVDSERLYEIAYNDMSARFALKKSRYGWVEYTDMDDIHEVEVIGNIYDNPELLKEHNK